MPNMKTALPPSVQLQLAEVAGIADGLAATSCDFPASAFAGMDVAGILNNLDEVASAVTAEQLADAPAMLNGAARAFRQTFPGTSEGFAEAGRLQTIASDLAAFLMRTA